MISGRHFRFRLDPAMSRVVGHRPAPPNLPVLSSYIPPWRRPLRPCTRLYGNRSRHALPAPGAAPTPLVWRATTQRLSMRCCRLGHDGAAPPRLPCVDGQSGLQVGSETICGVGCCSLLSVLAGSGDRFEVGGARAGAPSVFLNYQWDPACVGGSCGSQSLRRRCGSFCIYFGARPGPVPIPGSRACARDVCAC